MAKCPVKGCTNSRGANKVMCKGHWRMVPAKIQREVYREYDLIKDDGFRVSGAWARAVAKAIKAVKQGG